MKTYRGERGRHGVDVTVNGAPLNPRLDLRSHSPTGFEWGYAGSGPAQLALALLADCRADDQEALDFYQPFKFAVVAKLPNQWWELTSQQIDAALRTIRAEQCSDAPC